MTTRPTEGAFDRPSRIHRRGVSPDPYPLLPAGSITGLESLNVSHAFRDAVALIFVIFSVCCVAVFVGAVFSVLKVWFA